MVTSSAGPFDLLLRSPRVMLPGGEQPASVAVRAGRIAAVTDYHRPPPARCYVDLGEDLLLPGLVDTHVHVNEPGRTEWEGFLTATRAAALGGVTTMIDMPLNCLPPTTDAAALEVKRVAARTQCAIDVGFWGGAVPGNADRLAELHEAGVYGFKCFLSDSGVPEFPPLGPGQLVEAMRRIRELDSLLLVHAEAPELLREAPDDPRYPTFLASRPELAESSAVSRTVRAAIHTGARTHILHVSSAGAAKAVARGKRAGAAVTAETCPHYLTLTADEVPDGGTEFKCCPPIRSAAHRDHLWDALADGTLDCVVSDHSPCNPELKRGRGFGSAWGGIASLQLGLPLVWTEARRRGFAVGDVVRWMCENPAKVAGIRDRGRIVPGCRADLVRSHRT
ncbi:allantoinase AllB [Micromonospora sp. KLBMP9576]|uniref:allantoinase AllB n=1 Tax=Micromonospora sp. KLBMP9576 TaxID=3424769 RepID=UPI003D8E2D5A